LETRPDFEVTSPTSALEGIPYSLPMLQFDLTLARSISGCPQPLEIVLNPEAPADKQAKKTLSGHWGRLALATKVEAKEHYTPGERYLIDYEPMKSAFATSNLAIGVYPSGALKSLNASADDQTGQVLQQTLQFAFKVASLTSGVPPLDLAAVAPGSGAESAALLVKGFGRAEALANLEVRLAAQPMTSMVACRRFTEIWRAKADSNDSAQEDQTALLETATVDVARTTQVAGLRNAQLKHLDALDKALTEQAAANTALKALVEARKGLDGKLGTSQSLTWPKRFDGRSEDLPAGDQKKLADLLEVRNARVISPVLIAAWINYVRGKNAALADELLKEPTFAGLVLPDGTPATTRPGKPECEGAGADVGKCIAAYFDARIGLQMAATELPPCPDAPTLPPASLACRPKPTSIREEKAKGDAKDVLRAGRLARDGRPDPGVFIRSPAQGVLRICKGLTSPKAGGAVAPGERDDPPVSCSGDDVLFASKPALGAPQLGQLRYLPVSNAAFEASELSFTLREDGTLDTFGYKKTRAAAAGIVGAANDAATQYKTYEDDRQTRVTTRLKTAREQQIAALQFQIDKASKQKDLLKLQAPDSPDALKEIKTQTTALETEIALLKAEKGKLDAEAALAEARAKAD
jgi:hypothetical protein